VVGASQLEPVRVGDVVGGHLARELLGAHSGGTRGRVDLVVDVGDVDDQRHRISLVLEEALELLGNDVGTGVADVDAGVDRRAARVDADPAGVARLERRELARAGVVQAYPAHARGS
jgi:hypothetical protein